ncbi:TPA: c-type cytochrome [Candidatus Poribacteria bacterium]|nr:c-type cytochrome [Candidatus Poribacteria bacterium]HIA66148.1 c-type cytochrome [Candidatus Poribacteria bacterium]HIB91761.1 c-type cytochrome [Candidatus Poribacteria bacterium]HIC01030.1 c-type cytochrome [Candidatus Poribacteria bacterium]HIN27283.1 c-type cytochrome [Candidatus Poribacteria bacterium]
MAEQEERYYRISLLNKWFAISSIIFVSVLLWMFHDDYSRKWKEYQREFRQLEVDKTKDAFLEAEAKLLNQAEYKETMYALDEAERALDDEYEKVEELKTKIAKEEADNFRYASEYQRRKSLYDEVKYLYEEASAHHGKHDSSGKLKAQMQDKERKMNELAPKIEGSNQKLESLRSELKDYEKEKKRLEKGATAFMSEVDVLKSKLRKVDPQLVSIGNNTGLQNEIYEVDSRGKFGAGVARAMNVVGNYIRDLPVLDLSSPYYKIDQIVVPDVIEDLKFSKVPKVDRCTTCHQGIQRKDYMHEDDNGNSSLDPEEDRNQDGILQTVKQPFRAHPRLDLFLSSDSPHPIEQFGCTSCHAGRGRGTSFSSVVHKPSSHYQEEEWGEIHNYPTKNTHPDWFTLHHWERPMFPTKYAEAGCFKCHAGESEIEGGEKLTLGLALIEKAGCYGCHNIQKYEERKPVGPSLTKIASKIEDEDWTRNWIKNPQDFRHNTWMPKFYGLLNNRHTDERNDQEVHAIAHYLYQKSSEFEMADIPVRGDAGRGETLFNSLGCMGCHQISPESSIESTDFLPTDTNARKKAKIETHRNAMRIEQGPNLIGTGVKTSPKWVYNWLKDPNRYNPDTRMPNLRLTDQEAVDLTSYLVTLRQTFKETNVRSLNKEILKTIAAEFLEGSKSEAQVEKEIKEMSTDWMLSFTGQKLISHYGCYGCHNIPGFENQKPVGVDLTYHGSKMTKKLDFGSVQEAIYDQHDGHIELDSLKHLSHTNYGWFSQKLLNPRIWDTNAIIDRNTEKIANLDDAKVVKLKKFTEKTRMPNFGLSDLEVEAIVTALLGFVNQEALSSKIIPRTPENVYVERGQSLAREYNCTGCHLLEDKGGSIRPSITNWLVHFEERDKNDAQTVTNSYSPPNLIGEGQKVQTNWLYSFFRAPTPIRPWLKVRMPTFNFTEEQVNALVRYFSYLDQQDFPFVDDLNPEFTEGGYANAKNLLEQEFQCIKCHIKGNQMPGGSPANWAPNLAMAKKRLKPKWIVKWLLDPQKLLPGTKMPSYFDPASLTAEEENQIHALRDYILAIE